MESYQEILKVNLAQIDPRILNTSELTAYVINADLTVWALVYGSETGTCIGNAYAKWIIRDDTNFVYQSDTGEIFSVYAMIANKQCYGEMQDPQFNGHMVYKFNTIYVQNTPNISMEIIKTFASNISVGDFIAYHWYDAVHVESIDIDPKDTCIIEINFKSVSGYADDTFECDDPVTLVKFNRI